MLIPATATRASAIGPVYAVIKKRKYDFSLTGISAFNPMYADGTVFFGHRHN
jgi:hypothetical protein